MKILLVLSLLGAALCAPRTVVVRSVNGSPVNDVEGPLGFSYSNCGAPNDPLLINSITVSPDPVNLKENVTVAASATLSDSLTSPLQVQIELKKKIGVWVKIPCVDNVGSCTYADVCAMIPKGPCPPSFQHLGIPCQCPFPANTYKLPSISFPINLGNKVPSWLTDGEFQIQATVNSGGERQMCLSLEVSITA